MNLNKSIKNYDFSIIGGDQRQVYLAEILARKGYGVLTYGLWPMDCECKKSDNLCNAVLSAENIVVPIPMIKNNNQILHHSNEKDLNLDNFIKYIQSGQQIFGGCLPNLLINYMKKNNIEFYDFMADEAMAVFNSIATAEGIIAEAVAQSPINLHNSNCLILGYGKCGKTLADKLKQLSCRTTVCIHNYNEKVLAEVNGHQVVFLENLIAHMKAFDFIFNTVPKIILDEKLLKTVQKTALILDISAAPGGVDFIKADELGISAGIYPGLPGKYAPKSSAIALADFIINKK